MGSSMANTLYKALKTAPVSSSPSVGSASKAVKDIVDEAIIKCDKGSSPSALRTENHGTSTVEKYLAHDEDREPYVNIFPFGDCSLDKKPCDLSGLMLKWMLTDEYSVMKAAQEDFTELRKEIDDADFMIYSSVMQLNNFLHEGQSTDLKDSALWQDAINKCRNLFKGLNSNSKYIDVLLLDNDRSAGQFENDLIEMRRILKMILDDYEKVLLLYINRINKTNSSNVITSVAGSSFTPNGYSFETIKTKIDGLIKELDAQISSFQTKMAGLPGKLLSHVNARVSNCRLTMDSKLFCRKKSGGTISVLDPGQLDETGKPIVLFMYSLFVNGEWVPVERRDGKLYPTTNDGRITLCMASEVLYRPEYTTEMAKLSLEEIAAMSETSDCISYWWQTSDHKITVYNPAMARGPIKVVRNYSRVSIDAHVKIVDNKGVGSEVMATNAKDTTSDTLRNWAIQGINMWSGTFTQNIKNGLCYDCFGVDTTVTVTMNLHLEDDGIHKRTIINLLKEGHPHAKQPLWFDWAIGNVATINMYREFSVTTYGTHIKHIIAHEFGHALGIYDAYDPDKQNSNVAGGVTDEAPDSKEWSEPSTSMPKGDLMRNNTDITSNNIEMLLEAWKLNKWQAYSEHYQNLHKSEAIRIEGYSQNFEIDLEKG